MSEFILSLLTVFSLSLSAGAASTVGFSKGNEFTAYVIRGNVLLYCQDNFGRSYSQFTSCSAEFLDPVNMDSFVGPSGVDADSVELKSTYANGDTEDQTEDYHSKTGKSDRFNLWISTLFQTPLLDVGVNRIEYNLTKQGKSVAQGQFTAKVNVGKTLQCPQGTLWDTANGDQLCRNTAFACQRYFEKYNDCQ